MRWLETETIVRFNEVDALGVAWYGHYMAWFEVGRMALLGRFDLMPDQLTGLGYIAPVVSLKCEFKHPAACGDPILIRTTAVKPETASLIFKFEILHKDRQLLLARGETTQVLLTKDRKMVYRIRGEIEKRLNNVIQYCLGA